jgi:polar amino acid transport system substrate-binding protein
MIKFNHSNLIGLPLEQLISPIYKIFKELKIDGDEIDFFIKNLEKLAYHHTPTAEHSIRTAILAYQTGKINFPNYTKALFYAGLLHDIGKLYVSVNLLNKIDFDDNDREKIKIHAMAGYSILKDQDHNFSAEVILYVHPYPTIKPESTFDNETQNLIKELGKAVSICDSYDSMRTRTDKINKPNPKSLTRLEAFSALRKSFEDKFPLIGKLYLVGAF